MKPIISILICAIAFFNSCQSQSVEYNIILINTGPYDKGRIAKLISKINAFKPKVISLDIAFSDYNGNNDDVSLSEALHNCSSLVMASTIESIDEDRVYFALASRGEFSPVQKKTGFVSAKVEEGENELPEQFVVQENDFNGDIEYHFAIQTAISFDSIKAMSFIKNHS